MDMVLKHAQQSCSENNCIVLNCFRKKDIVFIICYLVGLIFRIQYLISYPVPVRDSYTYRNMILLWNETGSFPTQHSIPPLGIGLFRFLSTHIDYDIIKVSIIANMAIAMSIIFVTIKFASEYIHSFIILLCFGIVLSTHPSLIEYSCEMIRENSFIMFSVISLIALTKFIHTNKYYYLIESGLFSGFSLLCKHEGFELIVISLVICLIRFKWRSFGFIFLYLFAVLVSIWVILAVTDVNAKTYISLISNKLHSRFLF